MSYTTDLQSNNADLQNILNTVNALPEKGQIPSGIVCMWSGSVISIPNGWLLCDGQNGTPNLVDRFIIGAGNSYEVASVGGEATHTLTVDELPSHTHNFSKSNSAFYVTAGGGLQGGSGGLTTGSATNNTVTIDNAGGNNAHNNMPPYYALCFIMKA